MTASAQRAPVSGAGHVHHVAGLPFAGWGGQPPVSPPLAGPAAAVLQSGCARQCQGRRDAEYLEFLFDRLQVLKVDCRAKPCHVNLLLEDLIIIMPGKETRQNLGGPGGRWDVVGAESEEKLANESCSDSSK